MSTKQFLDYQGLQDVASKVNTRLKTVTTMPISASDGAVRLYIGETSASYTKGHIYQYQTNAWVDITNMVDTVARERLIRNPVLGIETKEDLKDALDALAADSVTRQLSCWNDGFISLDKGALVDGCEILATYDSDNTYHITAIAPNGKFYTVTYNGINLNAYEIGGTVDQIYNASSTNAQSGTAVAGAVSTKISAVTEMPVNPIENQIVLFVGTSGTYQNGMVYKYQNGMWSIIGGLNTPSETVITLSLASVDVSGSSPVITLNLSQSISAVGAVNVSASVHGVLQGLFTDTTDCSVVLNASTMIITVNAKDSLGQVIQFPTNSSITIPAFTVASGLNNIVHASSETLSITGNLTSQQLIGSISNRSASGNTNTTYNLTGDSGANWSVSEQTTKLSSVPMKDTSYNDVNNSFSFTYSNGTITISPSNTTYLHGDNISIIGVTLNFVSNGCSYLLPSQNLNLNWKNNTYSVILDVSVITSMTAALTSASPASVVATLSPSGPGSTSGQLATMAKCKPTVKLVASGETDFNLPTVSWTYGSVTATSSETLNLTVMRNLLVEFTTTSVSEVDSLGITCNYSTSGKTLEVEMPAAYVITPTGNVNTPSVSPNDSGLIGNTYMWADNDVVLGLYTADATHRTSLGYQPVKYKKNSFTSLDSNATITTINRGFIGGSEPKFINGYMFSTSLIGNDGMGAGAAYYDKSTKSLNSVTMSSSLESLWGRQNLEFDVYAGPNNTFIQHGYTLSYPFGNSNAVDSLMISSTPDFNSATELWNDSIKTWILNGSATKDRYHIKFLGICGNWLILWDHSSNRIGFMDTGTGTVTNYSNNRVSNITEVQLDRSGTMYIWCTFQGSTNKWVSVDMTGSTPNTVVPVLVPTSWASGSYDVIVIKPVEGCSYSHFYTSKTSSLEGFYQNGHLGDSNYKLSLNGSIDSGYDFNSSNPYVSVGGQVPDRCNVVSPSSGTVHSYYLKKEMIVA